MRSCATTPSSRSRSRSRSRPSSASASRRRRTTSSRSTSDVAARAARRLGSPVPDEPPGRPRDDQLDPDADPESVARAICLRLLTGRPHTRAELAAALARRAVPADAAEAVLGRFGEVGLIDDRAFAAAWVSSRQIGRGLGRKALAHELRRRGVAADDAAEALASVSDADEELAACALVAKRLPATRSLAPEVRMRRLAGMLGRKGYPAGLAFRVIREALAAEASEVAEAAAAGGWDGFDELAQRRRRRLTDQLGPPGDP